MDAATSRTSRKQVRHLEDLLRLTECVDLPELVEFVDSQMQMRALTLDVQADDNRIEALTEAGGYVLDLPVPLGRFWRTIDLLDADLEHRAAAEQLPGWTSEKSEQEDLTALIADFFDTSLHDFVDHVGGGWHAQDPDHFVGINEAEYRWYGSGTPMQVLLGIGTDEAVVAEPVLTGPGLHGPATVARGQAASVWLRRRETLRRLSEQVRDTEALVRSQLSFCPGCRVTLHRGRASEYCVDCLARYFGTIVD
jgi:hypothetical protein